MQTYKVRYVHKISPSDKDVGPDVQIPDNAFSNRNTLGAALRKAKVLMAGASIPNFRVEGNKIIIFPRLPGSTTYWHAVVLTAVEASMDPGICKTQTVLDSAKAAGLECVDLSPASEFTDKDRSGLPSK